MWLITTRGFFSAVNKPSDSPDVITVRARCEDDIRNLADLLPDCKPYATRATDYEWRLKCSASEWAKVCAVLALEIDYGNFKDEVKRKQGASRAGIYSSVWSVLLRLERPGRYVGSYGFDQPPLPVKTKGGKNRAAGTPTTPKKKGRR